MGTAVVMPPFGGFLVIFNVKNSQKMKDVVQLPWLHMLDLSQSFMHISGLCYHCACKASRFYDAF